MSTTSSKLRRISLDTVADRHDIAAPQRESLAGALASVGVHLSPDEHVVGPGGTRVDTDTAVRDLREGGLYVVASTRTFDDAKRRSRSRHRGVPVLPWALVGFGIVAVTLAYGGGVLRVDAPATSLLAVVAALTAVAAALVMVMARTVRTRTSAAPVVIIAALFAGLTLLGAPMGWSAAQVLIVASALAVVGIRAAPSMLVGVDPGYHIDYGRFMVLRWTVRGRVPEFIERVDDDRVVQLVEKSEARLEASVRTLSVVAALGIPAAALPMAGDGLTEMIAAGCFVLFALLGLLLTSRRMASAALRVPPRCAAAVGVIGFAVLVGAQLPGTIMALTAGVLLFAGMIAGVMVLPLARGERSLGWSRTGDIVDSICVALVTPAGLVAAGTLNFLQGVLSS